MYFSLGFDSLKPLNFHIFNMLSTICSKIKLYDGRRLPHDYIIVTLSYCKHLSFENKAPCKPMTPNQA